jgi:hypothetical protein
MAPASFFYFTKQGKSMAAKAPYYTDEFEDKKTLAVSRRHVLGPLYTRCEHIESLPVFLDGDAPEEIGLVDESLGIYADAFVFHLEDQLCKRLAAGQFTYSIDYSEGDGDQMNANLSGHPVKPSKIILVPRKGYDKPIPRSAKKTNGDENNEPTPANS